MDGSVPSLWDLLPNELLESLHIRERRIGRVSFACCSAAAFEGLLEVVLPHSKKGKWRLGEILLCLVS